MALERAGGEVERGLRHPALAHRCRGRDGQRWGQGGPYVERGDDRVVHQRGGIACTQGRTHQELGRQGGRGCTLYLRSEEHTSELQSPCNLVCRLLLEKKKKKEFQQPMRAVEVTRL